MPGARGPARSSPEHPFPPPVAPNGSLRIPSALPERPPYRPSDRDQIVLDGEQVPLAFAQDILRSIAPSLLDAVDHATIHRDDDDGGLPHNDASASRLVLASAALPYPTLVLSVSFDDSDDTLELPAHRLVWATLESVLFEPLLDSEDSPAEVDDEHDSHIFLSLPTYPLRLPCRKSWSALHDFIYTHSSSDLLDTLLHRSIPDPTPAPYEGPPSPTHLPREAIIDRLEGVRAIFLNASALQIPSEELFETLRMAWQSLYALLEEARHS